MGRKGLSKIEKEQLILLLATDEPTAAIAEQLDVSKQTVLNYRSRYPEEIEQKRAEIEGRTIEKKTKKKTETKPTPPAEDTAEEEEEEKPDPIEVLAEKNAPKQGATVALDEMIRIYKDMIRSGKAIIEDQFRYKSSIENMGIKWTDFLKFAHKIGYEIIVSEYLDELRKVQMDESLTRITTMQALHEGEIEDMGEPTDEEIRKVIEIDRGGK